MTRSKTIWSQSLLAGVALFTAVSAQAVETKLAPSFTLPELKTGRPVQLQDFRGKVVYLDFWASWCGPCRKSLPLLNGLREEFKGTGKFEVVAVNVDANPEDGRKFLQKYPVTYPVVSDPTGRVPPLYDLIGMPTAFILDTKGQIHVVHEGFKDSDVEHIRAKVRSLIQQGESS